MNKMTETELDRTYFRHWQTFAYWKANNKYIQFYVDKKPSKYITYVDTNNLYG